jgi:hypothetical protein
VCFAAVVVKSDCCTCHLSLFAMRSRSSLQLPCSLCDRENTRQQIFQNRMCAAHALAPAAAAAAAAATAAVITAMLCVVNSLTLCWFTLLCIIVPAMHSFKMIFLHNANRFHKQLHKQPQSSKCSTCQAPKRSTAEASAAAAKIGGFTKAVTLCACCDMRACAR